MLFNMNFLIVNNGMQQIGTISVIFKGKTGL